MTDRFHSVRRLFALAAALLALCLACISSAHADVVGRLHVSVTDSDTDKPVAAAITLHDTTGVRPDITLTADAQGSATSPPLEAHAWQIKSEATGYDTDTRTVAVAADTTTDVDVVLEKTEKVVKITGNRTLIRPNQPTDSTNRNQGFIQKYPSTGGNPQDFKRFVKTVPGFVNSSVNVAHPRGEHGSTSIYIQGFLAPGALQGRAGPIISPQVIQNADVQTGAYSPEYGSETAAIVNLSLRSGTINPFRSLTLQGGGYDTSYEEFSVGGQGGALLENGVTGPAPRRFRYFLDFSNRGTSNVLEPPQPGDQSAHNHGIASTLFGNLEYVASPKDQFALVLNASPARTQIANRTGLPLDYAPVGQGFGYGGARNADGSESGVTPDPAVVGSQTLPVASQQGAGQDVSQTDDNSFGLLNYRHTFTDQLTGLLSLGANHSRLDLRNNSPSIDLNSVDANGLLNIVDSSIEFNPVLSRKYNQQEIAGSLTLAQGTHTLKVGFLLNGQHGDESYQFAPQSQLALDALAATDTRLAPAGTPLLDGMNNPILDVLGNPVYLITPGSPTPTLTAKRTGYYNAGYIQDTWRATRKATLNYGLRLDGYGQKQDLGQYGTTSIATANLSPRFNLAYAVTPRTVGRLSYNRLFTQPPLAQGAILGTILKPELINQYDASLEHQIGATQTVKLAYYYKDIRGQNDTGLLLPYTQIGAYTTLQYTAAGIHGLEVSYDVTPRNNVGVGGYLAYAHSTARPRGFDQTGADAPDINDHDQRDTVSAGLSYTLPSQAFIGLDYYYGSGEASSVLAPIGPSDSNLLNGGKRNSNQLVNLRLSSPPRFVGGFAGLGLDVENVFDSRAVLNFNSGFSGTRFQQGRRVLLSVIGTF